MDGLSSATTVISVLQTAWQVIEYVKAVRGAGEDRQKLLLELIRARGLLSTLNDLTEDVADKNWSRALQSLEGPGGPLVAFRVLLEEVADNLAAESKSRLRLSRFFRHHHEKKATEVSSSAGSPKASGSSSEPRNEENSRSVSLKITAAIRDLKWPYTQTQILELLTTLERIKTHFLVALTSDNVRLSQLIYSELGTVHSEVMGVKNTTTAIREHQEGSKAWTTQQKLVFQSITTTNFSRDFAPDEVERLKRYAGGVLTHDKFLIWRDYGGSLLLSGGPGSGKTSILKIVENYLKSSGPPSEVLVASIYFSFRQPGDQNLQAVLASVVEHMLRVRPQVQKYYNKLMLIGEGPLEVDDCLRIIHRARQDFQHFYLLLDAFDECDHRHAGEIVERLTKLCAPLKIFATFRPGPLEEHFSHNMVLGKDFNPDSEHFLRDLLASSRLG